MTNQTSENNKRIAKNTTRFVGSKRISKPNV